MRERPVRGRDVPVRRFARAVLVASLLLSAATARARPAAEADAYTAALTRAIAAKERALDVNEPPRWEEALRLFQEAAALRYTRESTYEIGFAAERLARQDLAVEAYEAAIDLGLVGAPRARAQAFVAANAAGLARLALRGPAGTRVRVAGVDRGRLPLNRPLVLFPGDIRIDLVDAAGAPASIGVHLQAGHLDVLDLAHTPPATAAPERVEPRPPPPPPAPPPAPEVRVAPAVPAPRAPIAAYTAPESAGPRPLAEAPAAPPRDAEPEASMRGWWVASAGVVVAAVSVALIPISSGRIEDDRQKLVGECVPPVVNDTCTAMTGHREQAQSLSDSIATWKAVRTGAWIGVGLGVATVATGLILRNSDQTTAAAAARPALVIDRDGHFTLGLAWTCRF
jgi:hypothetical protein